MVTLTALWLPIVGSAVAVFLLSSLVHTVFGWHNSDYRALANEDEVRAAIQKSSPAPGQYMLPHCLGPKAVQAPEMQQKFRDGPVGLVTLRARGLPRMGESLALWFLYTLAIGVLAGYLASRLLPGGAAFMAVLRLVATVAFMTYAGGSVQNGIWMGKPWASVGKEMFDGALYALATGAVFAALWPH